MESFSNANDIYLFLIIFPHTSLHCKLVPIHYRKFECGLLHVLICLSSTEPFTLSVDLIGHGKLQEFLTLLKLKCKTKKTLVYFRPVSLLIGLAVSFPGWN